ncbi:glycosyltransferase family 1 protein [Butyrivibrio sp. INlla16]|uniref:glycosyltransferase family 1 protein n=1 Tax=Butyrivibrio sp. INlla16 TaxID=1520807 RepID=UPI000B805518|nr:glycosyltransferase family 1 protein [Butyrivibrio sp. INlla16]
MSKAATEFDIDIREIAVVDTKKDDIEWADAILTIRPFEVGAFRVVEAGKKAGKKIIMYLDDDLLNLPNIFPNRLRKFLSGILYNKNCEYLIKSLDLCDVLWGSNPVLLDKYKQYVTNGRCEIADVAYDIADMVQPRLNDGDFKILFAGSGDHAGYINEFIIPAINELHYKRYNISFVCVGLDPGALIKCDAKTEFIPWIRDFDEFNKLIRSKQVDIGVAPILADDFHRCKYINKFIEYSRYGIAGIYSDDYPYKMIVVDDENGLLAENTVESWAQKIEYAINNPQNCLKIAETAQKICKERFSTSQMISTVKEKIPELFVKQVTARTVKYKPSIFINNLRKYVTAFVEKYEYDNSQKNISDASSKILLVYAGYTTTTELISKILQKASIYKNASFVAKESTMVFAKDIKESDIIVFCRGADLYMGKIAEAAHKAGRKTILYLDDDLYGIYKGTVYGDALLKCLSNCDILWASNPHIYDKYKELAPNIAFVEGKVFDPIDKIGDISDVLDKYVILYAGSPSHRDTIQNLIVPALNKVYDNYKEFSAVFMGFDEGTLSGCKFDKEYIPWTTDMNEYRDIIQSKGCHIGLAVIKDDEFGNCKYYNKYLEYSRMGIAGIYSDVIPYRLVVHNDENGIIVKNTPDSWAESILKLLQNEDDRRNIILNSQDDLRQNFKLKDVIDKLAGDIPEIGSYHAPDVKVRYHVNVLLHQLKYSWRVYIASRY